MNYYQEKESASAERENNQQKIDKLEKDLKKYKRDVRMATFVIQ